MSTLEFERRAGPRWIVPAIVGLHLAIALALAARLDIWIDEAYTLETTGRGLRYALRQALGFEWQPPLYYLLVASWRKLNDSIFFARLFSTLCGGAALFAVAGVSRRWLPEVHPGWLTALAAFHPFSFYATLEIRLYSLALLLSALLLLLFYDGYLAEDRRPGARWAQALVAVAALYTQYYLGFLLAAGAVVLLVLKQWRPLRDFLLAMAGVAVCFAPMLWIVLRQVSSQTAAAPRLPVLEGVISLAGRIQEYTLPTAGLPDAWRPWVRVGFVLVLTLLVFVRRRAVGPREAAVWTLTAAMFLLFLAVRVALTGPHLMQLRHTIALFLPGLLTALSAVLLLGEPRRRGLVAWSGALVLLSAASMSETYRALAREGDWARVGSFLERNARPGEPILVLTAEAAMPLKHYYQGPGPLVVLPVEEDFKSYDSRELQLRSEEEIDAALVRERVAGHPPSVWVVTHPLQDWLGIDYGFDVLEGYLARRYRLEREVMFFWTRVRRFTAPRDPAALQP